MSDDALFGLGIIGLFIAILCVLFVEFLAIVLIAGAIASHFGFTGILWWVVAFGVFCIINAILLIILRLY